LEEIRGSIHHAKQDIREGFAKITFLYVAIPHIDTWKNATTTCSMGSQDVFISANGSRVK